MKRTFEKSTEWKKGGVHVLHLQGTLAEMSAAHGALLREEIKQGALPYLGQKNDHLIQSSYIFRDRPKLFKFVKSLIHIFIHRPMLAHVPRQYVEEAKALARTSGIPLDIIKEACVQADTLVVMLRFFLGRHVLSQLAGGFPGCTSVVACGPATESGGVIHARNMDYPTVGKWDVFPTVYYFDPQGVDRGQRFISLSTAGIHTPGITAVNESGLSLAAHFHCAKAVSPFGTPIQFIGAEIARRAHTIGQAVDVASNFERAGTWSIVVTSAKENTGVVIEMVHGKLSVRGPERGLLAHSNHFHTPEFQEREVLLSASVADDYVGRYNRAIDLLGNAYGRVNRQTVAQILGDHFDHETGRVRSQSGHSVSVVTTVTSMIAELSQNRFWIANSGRSPTSLGDYTGFNVDEDFKNFDEREPEIFSWSTEGAQTIRGTPKEHAFKIFREAYKSFHTDYDIAKAAEHAETASKADPEEGHFHLAHGHFRMRLNQPERALVAFELAKECALSAHMKNVATLFTGHALDCLGRRSDALSRYQDAIKKTVDPHLRREARRCIKRPYSSERATRMTFDLQFCDSLEYA